MNYYQYFGGLIWTTHAITRLIQRGLSQDLACQTFHFPDRKFRGKQYRTSEYQKHFDDLKVTIIMKKNQRKEWVVLSCWIDPPLPGTIDEAAALAYQKSQQKPFWQKLLYFFKNLS